MALRTVRARRIRGARVSGGIDLSAAQWASWFAEDEVAREAFRAEVRARLVAWLQVNRSAHGELEEFAVISDRGRVVERVYRDGHVEPGPTTPPRLPW